MASHRHLPLSGDGKRRAAVAIVLREELGVLRLLFMERTKRAGDPWSGHLAFPGGRMEERDGTLRDTAERETREEIGLDLSSAEYLGQLDDVTGATVPVVVSGFIYNAVQTGDFELNHEVQDVFWTAFDELFDPERHTEYCYQSGGIKRSAQAIDLLGSGRPLLWGLTYRFVAQFLRLLDFEIPSR